jgi:hypothetical protein
MQQRPKTNGSTLLRNMNISLWSACHNNLDSQFSQSVQVQGDSLINWITWLEEGESSISK